MTLRQRRWIRLLAVISAMAVSWGPMLAGGLEPGEAQGPGLTASLDRDSSRVGGILWLTLDYRLPPGARLSEPPQVKGLEGLTVLEQVLAPDRIRVRLLVDRLGSWETGPLGLVYRDEGGQERLLETDPLALQVLSNLGEKPEEATLRPIQDIVPTDAAWSDYILWGGIAAAALLLAAGGLWFYRRRRVEELIPSMEEPPHLRARGEILRLEALGLFEKGQVKAFYFFLSAILRRYLESLRGFPAAEYTTEEIARRMEHEKDRRLLPLLRQADLTKFADRVPTAARKEEDVRAALAYIRDTAPRPEALDRDGPPPEAIP